MFAFLAANLVIFTIFSTIEPFGVVLASSVTESKYWPNKDKSDLAWPSSNQRTTEPDVKTAQFLGSQLTVLGVNERPLLSYMQPLKEQIIESPSDNNGISVLSRSMPKDGKIRTKSNNGSKFSIGAIGYFTIIVFASLVFLAFLLVFMYVQQRDEVPQANESNSHVSEAKQLLQNRLYVVKRYIPYHFDAGLPCPEKYNPSSSSSSLTVSPNHIVSTSKPSASSANQVSNGL